MSGDRRQPLVDFISRLTNDAGTVLFDERETGTVVTALMHQDVGVEKWEDITLIDCTLME